MPEHHAFCFGIVGCGTASIPVCEAIQASPRTRLAAVYDINKELAEDLEQRFQVRRTSSLEELLANPVVDAVYIAVPHYLLASLTAQALQAGKHALTEKPLALSLEEVDGLARLAEREKRSLGVFFEMRYAPAYAVAHELVRAGALGEIIGVQIQTLIDKPMAYWQSGYMGRSTHPWRASLSQAGGGVLLMNTSHLLDATLYVTGLRVKGVLAQIGHLVAEVEVEDTAAVTLRFHNGAIGSIFAGAHIAGARDNECIFLYGTRGQIRLPDPYGSQSLQMYLQQPFGEYEAGIWHEVSLEPVPVHARGIEEFTRAVQDGRCVPIGADDARQVLSIILAIYRSANEERMVSIS